MKSRWIEFCKVEKNIVFLVVFLVLSLLLLVITPWHMSNVQARVGVIVDDFVLDFFEPKDVSVYIMLLLYSIVLSCLIWLLQYPAQLLIALQTFFISTLLRYLSIYFFSLEPPVGIIPLKDPFLDFLVYADELITKDLFFSGHVEFATLAYLVIKNKTIKVFYLVGIVVLSILILVQHVHYSFDIIGAIVVTWTCHRIVSNINRK